MTVNPRPPSRQWIVGADPAHEAQARAARQGDVKSFPQSVGSGALGQCAAPTAAQKPATPASVTSKPASNIARSDDASMPASIDASLASSIGDAASPTSDDASKPPPPTALPAAPPLARPPAASTPPAPPEPALSCGPVVSSPPQATKISITGTPRPHVTRQDLLDIVTPGSK